MALQEIKQHIYKDIFSLQVVNFEKACVVNEAGQNEDYSIYYIKEGQGKYQIDFKSYEFDGAVLFFLSPGQVFSVDSETIQEAYRISFIRDFYCIQTHDREVSCNGVLFNNVYNTPFVKPNKEERDQLDRIIQSLIAEFEGGHAAQYDMLQSYLKQFIIHSVRIKKELHPESLEIESQLYKDFSTLVEVNFRAEHSISYYANRLGLSPKSLSKHFLRQGYEKPSAYIKNRILLETKRKLLYSDLSVKAIAYELGFNDPAYFTRFFSKATGSSPKQFKTLYYQ